MSQTPVELLPSLGTEMVPNTNTLKFACEKALEPTQSYASYTSCFQFFWNILQSTRSKAFLKSTNKPVVFLLSLDLTFVISLNCYKYV